MSGAAVALNGSDEGFNDMAVIVQNISNKGNW
jgi:hypothetical protein